MKTLYHLYNENFEITNAQFFEEGQQPENAVFVEQTIDFVKPKYNPITNEVFEAATTEEIEQKKQIEIEKLKAMQFEELSTTDWYVIRKMDTGIDIPLEIINQRVAIREKYDLLISEL